MPCLLIAGCAARPQTTRMTVDDFQVISSAMATSFLASNALARRTPNSPLWIVSLDKVTNLSSDVMTTDEQWAIMARLLGQMPIASLWQQKNIRFVLPPERTEQIRQSDINDEARGDFGAARNVSHTMTATFTSITRAQATDRTDIYYCEFDIINLTKGLAVWNDRFKYKRAARGHIWN